MAPHPGSRERFLAIRRQNMRTISILTTDGREFSDLRLIGVDNGSDHGMNFTFRNAAGDIDYLNELEIENMRWLGEGPTRHRDGYDDSPLIEDVVGRVLREADSSLPHAAAFHIWMDVERAKATEAGFDFGTFTALEQAAILVRYTARRP